MKSAPPYGRLRVLRPQSPTEQELNMSETTKYFVGVDLHKTILQVFSDTTNLLNSYHRVAG